MSFNENTRVKIPALIHLTRLGLQIVSKNFLYSMLSAIQVSTLEEETQLLANIASEEQNNGNFLFWHFTIARLSTIKF